MKAGLAILALAGAALASPFPQGSSSSGCQSTVAGTFEITVVNVTMSSKRSLESRQKSGTLMLTLNNGMLMDQAGRTGYIAANDQFQFDNPVQAGALTTSGWSVCSNGSLALKGNCIFYQCLSGSFYNLYDKSQGGQCAAIYIETMMMGAAASSGAASSGASVSQVSDGQPQATTKVTQISDGQIQATTMMITQISDGQIQAPTGKPVSQISDGQPQAPTGRPVSQISDGQIQATTAKPPVPPMTGAPVSQISDGQIQATTAKPAVSQISDGQIQATTGAAVSQISDGQIQATTAKPAVSQISDGQIQATTGAAVSQISDGQIQATTGTSAAPAKYTGAANKEIAGSFALFAGVAGALALL